MDVAKLLSWFLDHKLFTGVVAIVVVLLACEFISEQHARPSSQDSLTHVDGQSTVQSETDDDSNSIDALFDASDARTASKYKLPANLSTPQIKQLTADTACAQEYWVAYFGWLSQYAEDCHRLSEMREPIFDRISTGNGFKNQNIPARWREIMDSDHSTAEFLAIGPMFLPLKYRFDAVRYHLIGGECTLGDVAFVRWISSFSQLRLLRLGPRLKSAYELQLMMVDDGFKLDADEKIKIGVMYPNFRDFLDLVRRKYDPATASTQPDLQIPDDIIPQVIGPQLPTYY